MHDSLIFVCVGTAIALSISAISISSEVRGRLDNLKIPENTQEAQNVHVSNTHFHRRNNNEFFAGVDLQKLLEKPIFGPPLFGDLDQYDLVHPAIVAEGSVLVRGSGRLVLDGDASDLIMKIDGEYFSLRELFGIGRGIDASPRPSEDPAANSGTDLEYINDLCSGSTIVPVQTCPLRRNFGVDSCNEKNTMCYCGGGYDYLTRTIKHRHFYCGGSSNLDCEDMFINKNISAYCCAPGTDEESYYCKTALDTLSTKPTIIDRYADCTDFVDGSVCLNVDKDDYLDAYAIAGIKFGLLDDPNGLVEVRRKINTKTWGITRDYVFDDGNKYYIELGNDVYADCAVPRLLMRHDHEYRNAFAAVWDCEGSEITFSRAENTNNFPSRQWGALYYALVLSKEHRSWYCLSKALTADEKTKAVGEVFTSESDQVYFVSFALKEYCAVMYLGARDVGDHLPEKSLGFDENDPERNARTNPLLKPELAYSVSKM